MDRVKLPIPEGFRGFQARMLRGKFETGIVSFITFLKQDYARLASLCKDLNSLRASPEFSEAFTSEEVAEIDGILKTINGIVEVLADAIEKLPKTYF